MWGILNKTKNEPATSGTWIGAPWHLEGRFHRVTLIFNDWDSAAGPLLHLAGESGRKQRPNSPVCSVSAIRMKFEKLFEMEWIRSLKAFYGACQSSEFEWRATWWVRRMSAERRKMWRFRCSYLRQRENSSCSHFWGSYNSPANLFLDSPVLQATMSGALVALGELVESAVQKTIVTTMASYSILQHHYISCAGCSWRIPIYCGFSTLWRGWMRKHSSCGIYFAHI